MDRKFFSKLGVHKDQKVALGRRRQATIGLENLEGRVVLTGLPTGLAGLVGGLGADFGGAGRFGGPGGFGGGPGGVGGDGTSSTLRTDAVQVNQAYQTFNSSILAAVASLRQSATTTAAPSAAGLTAFNTAVANAVTTLNTAVTADLANLTNTGTAIASTIAGYTATLQNEIESAGTGLANSTNTSVLSLDREIGTYIRSASQQSTAAIVADAPAGTVTGATADTFARSVQTAFQTFQTAINTAKQAAISGSTTLDSSAVTAATAALQTSLNSAIKTLGTSFAASTANPTAAVTTAVTNLTAQLSAITAPTANSSFSARTFAIAVNTAVSSAHMTINQALVTAINRFNSSLL